MGRVLVLLIPALAGCDVLIDACVEATFYPDHGIELKNAGQSDVRLKVVYDYWVEGEENEEGPDEPDELRVKTDFTYLVPNEKVTNWYPDEALEVTVTRLSDGLILYHEYISRGEFDKEHNRVEITVYP